MVEIVGVEPTRLAAADFESAVSADFTISPYCKNQPQTISP